MKCRFEIRTSSVISLYTALVWEKMEKQYLNKNSLFPFFMCGKNHRVGTYYFALCIMESVCRKPCWGKKKHNSYFYK